ncbi:AraC family transcriptional regulator [Flexithrix dorotheae]|uniref:AraC family transcriptional regulator n=1 Tax=Flexithrix dorotheae TaxID=70993 RepID=UPI00037D2172|nr:AraC family transcriptional regulator [Flexithrix dorotheae]
MKAVLEKIDKGNENSFMYRKIDLPFFDAPWHFHPEFELTFISESEGKRYVGDSLESFEPGDLVLIGPNLPHYWLNPKEKQGRSKSIVIQFSENFLGNGFFNIAELRSIADLLKKSERGILFLDEELRRDTKSGLEKMHEMMGIDKLLTLIKILDKLSKSKAVKILSSPGFNATIQTESAKRINVAYRYVMENFKHQIKLEDIAEEVNMTKEAFCRYFKRKTNRTFMEYVIRFRIGYSCRLLVETQLNVSEIGYESGFNTLANFNRQFIKLKGVSPKAYRKRFLD